MASVRCKVCKEKFNVVPSRTVAGPQKAKFCSLKCRGIWYSRHCRGKNNPRYQSGIRVLNCERCGKKFRKRKTEAISIFRKRKFCSPECAKHGQIRLAGKAHPLFKENSRRKDRRGKHGAWARAVISRDKATCQRCGARGVELHAHHIKPFHSHPEHRWDLDNGQTLCYRCHWTEHSTALNANGVNSGNIRSGNAEDNPEPSNKRKFVEGVTTRGRVYRRWEGGCDNCSIHLSKRWSDAKGKAFQYCSKSCMLKHRWKIGIMRPRR